MSSPRALALTLVFLVAPSLALAEFRFQIPAGFTDLSPGAPESNFEGVPPALLESARSGQFAAIAIEWGPEDGFYENFNAIIAKGALPVDESFLGVQEKALIAEFAKAVGPATVIEKSVVQLGGVNVMRFVSEINQPNLVIRQLQYMIPGGNEEFAVLTYSGTPETFDAYLPRYEAAAQGTTGMAQATILGIDWGRALRAGAITGGIAGLVALVVQLARRGRKAPSPARRPMPQRPMPRRQAGPPRSRP